MLRRKPLLLIGLVLAAVGISGLTLDLVARLTQTGEEFFAYSGARGSIAEPTWRGKPLPDFVTCSAKQDESLSCSGQREITYWRTYPERAARWVAITATPVVFFVAGLGLMKTGRSRAGAILATMAPVVLLGWSLLFSYGDPWTSLSYDLMAVSSAMLVASALLIDASLIVRRRAELAIPRT